MWSYCGGRSSRNRRWLGVGMGGGVWRGGGAVYPTPAFHSLLEAWYTKKHSHPEHRQHWTRAQAHTISLLTHGQDLKGTGRQSFRGGTGRWETDLRSRQGWILEPNQQFTVRSRCLETSNLVTGSPHHPVVRDVFSPQSATAHRGEVRPWTGVFHSTFRNSRASTGTPKIMHRDPT